MIWLIRKFLPNCVSIFSDSILIASGIGGISINPLINVLIYKPVPPTNIGVNLFLKFLLIASAASLHHFSTLYLSFPST